MGCGSSIPAQQPPGGGAAAGKAGDTDEKYESLLKQMEAQQQQLEALQRQLKQSPDQKAKPQAAEAAPEAKLDQPEGMFTPLDDLRGAKEFPRRGNDSSRCPSYARSHFNAATTLFIFLSHRWLEPTKPHPDHPDQGSPKLKLVLKACDKLLHSLPPGFKIALWMDWMSLNQDGNPAEELGDSMQRLIGSCDLLLTPIHDPEHRQWSKPSVWYDHFKQYLAPGWQGGRDAYWERPWCRIEATFAAVTPLTTEERGWQQKKKALQGRPLGAMMEAGRRPHVLFGTKELEMLGAPIFLPPMLHKQLEEYGADKVLENLTSQSDRGAIERFVAEAKLLQPKLEVGVVELGGGRARETCADGGVYEGGWRDGKKHGRGKYMYASGEVYEGDYEDGKRHGRGKFMFASGAVYEGDYEDGKRHGRGKHMYADGEVYEGDWKDDKKHGRGKYMYASGEVYEGDYEDGKKHGRGKYMYADGGVYEGDWKDNKKHGRGKKTSPGGEVLEEGEYRDGKFVG